jgi:hypothetical protein
MLDVVSQCTKKLHKIGLWTFYSLYEILYTKYKQRQTKGYARKTVPLIVEITKIVSDHDVLNLSITNEKIVNECLCGCSMQDESMPYIIIILKYKLTYFIDFISIFSSKALNLCKDFVLY